MAPLRVIVGGQGQPAFERLGTLLAAEPDVEIASGNGVPPGTGIPHGAPDVTFLGVPAFGSGGVPDRCPDDRRGPLVVFVTSLATDGNRAFDIGAFDYLVQPFSRQRVRAVLDRARQHLKLRQEAEAGAWLLAAFEHFRSKVPSHGQLLVRDGGRLRAIDPGEVEWLEAEGNYVRLHLGDESLVLREPLTALTRRLGDLFVRVHRRTAVRLALARELEIAGPADYRVVLHNGVRLRVGRRYRPDLEAALRGGAGPGSERLDASSATWIVPSPEL
jgi:two-component system, LytTR family, response regulator